MSDKAAATHHPGRVAPAFVSLVGIPDEDGAVGVELARDFHEHTHNRYRRLFTRIITRRNR